MQIHKTWNCIIANRCCNREHAKIQSFSVNFTNTVCWPQAESIIEKKTVLMQFRPVIDIWVRFCISTCVHKTWILFPRTIDKSLHNNQVANRYMGSILVSRAHKTWIYIVSDIFRGQSLIRYISIRSLMYYRSILKIFTFIVEIYCRNFK